MTKRLRSFICVVQLPAHPRVKFFGFGANNEVDAAVLGREHAAQLHPDAAVLGIATQEDVTGCVDGSDRCDDSDRRAERPSLSVTPDLCV